MENKLVMVRGGGDIATGTIYKLYKCGFDVLVLEIKKPSAIRRNVSFCEAVYDGKKEVEAKKLLSEKKLTMLVDENLACLKEFKPAALVDAILAKKNLGTKIDMAPVTIALGPGFEAGKDVDVVIETMRGHKLGRTIYEGFAIPNTNVPGVIAGFSKERVIHSPAEGTMKNVKKVTDTVKKGEIISYIDDTPVYATIDGLLRGLLRDGYKVTKGFKIADIDPRINEYENCFTISDKARCIAGGVLEAILHSEMEK